jgi:hypothetical protein
MVGIGIVLLELLVVVLFLLVEVDLFGKALFYGGDVEAVFYYLSDYFEKMDVL